MMREIHVRTTEACLDVHQLRHPPLNLLDLDRSSGRRAIGRRSPIEPATRGTGRRTQKLGSLLSAPRGTPEKGTRGPLPRRGRSPPWPCRRTPGWADLHSCPPLHKQGTLIKKGFGPQRPSIPSQEPLVTYVGTVSASRRNKRDNGETRIRIPPLLLCAPSGSVPSTHSVGLRHGHHVVVPGLCDDSGRAPWPPNSLPCPALWSNRHHEDISADRFFLQG